VLPGDCLEVLLSLPDCSVDAVVTDPPYGLAFMGKEWDTMPPAAKAGHRKGSILGVVPSGLGSTPENRVALYRKQGADLYTFSLDWATEVFRILKPGGHLLAFGGTRTYHRLACAVEDAGFEIRDSLHWVYGSGFPKSLDVSKAIDKAAGAERQVVGPSAIHSRGRNKAFPKRPGELTVEESGRTVAQDQPMLTAPATEAAARWDGWGTALKPSHEPIVVARKPLAGTVASNVLEWGTGALNIDGCRIEGSWGAMAARDGGGRSGGIMGESRGREASEAHPAGRWPPNILLTHSADCNGDCAPGCPVAGLDAQSGTLTSGTNTVKRASGKGRAVQSVSIGAESRPDGTPMIFYGDSGGASRFFPALNWDPDYDLPFLYCAKAPKSERPKLDDGTAWPTVKPLSLMRWLVRLVTPPGGAVLDPFAGTGTTGQACALEGFQCVLIERDPAALELIKVRLGKPVRAAQDSLF